MADRMEDMSDTELLARIAREEMAAFDALYRRHENRIYRFIVGKVRDPYAAGDILHETMMTIWQSAGRFEGRSSATTWMFGIAYRKAMNSFRKHGRETLTDDVPDQVDDGPGQFEAVAGSEHSDRITGCLDGLSPSHRAVVELAFYEDMGVREVAEAVGAAEGTVKTRLFHAKKLLRHCLETHGGMDMLVEGFGGVA